MTNPNEQQFADYKYQAIILIKTKIFDRFELAEQHPDRQSSAKPNILTDDQLLVKFKDHSAYNVFEKVCAGKDFFPIETLFNNPSINYKEVNNVIVEKFFKDTVKDDSTQSIKILFNLVSSQGFMSKINPDTISEVAKVLIDGKSIAKLKVVFSSDFVLSKVDNLFFHKLAKDSKVQDPKVIAQLFSIQEIYTKFKAYLTSKNPDEVYKLIKDISLGLSPYVYQVINEDTNFKEKIASYFVKKLSDGLIINELSSKNIAYLQLLSKFNEEFPEIRTIVTKKISDLKIKLASSKPKEAYNFAKGFNGEVVKLFFTNTTSNDDQKILENIAIALSSDEITHQDKGNWLKTVSNEIITLLIQANLIQEPFNKFLSAENDIKFFSKELVITGRVGLFALMEKQEALHEEMESPQVLIRTAVEKKQHEMLEYLSKSAYFSGSKFEPETADNKLFVEMFKISLNTARVLNDYKSLDILFNNFPNDKEMPTLDEGFLAFRCQLRNHPTFSYEPKNENQTQEGSNVLTESPDVCGKAPSFGDLANGMDLESINLINLQAAYQERVNFYDKYLWPDKMQEEASRVNNSDQPTVIYVPVENGVIKDKPFNVKIYEALPYVAAAAYEVYMAFAIDSNPPANGMKAYCARLNCGTGKHGADHAHTKAYNAEYLQKITHVVTLTGVKAVLEFVAAGTQFSNFEQADIGFAGLVLGLDALLALGIVGSGVNGLSKLAAVSLGVGLTALGASKLVDHYYSPQIDVSSIANTDELHKPIEEKMVTEL